MLSKIRQELRREGILSVHPRLISGIIANRVEPTGQVATGFFFGIGAKGLVSNTYQTIALYEGHRSVVEKLTDSGFWTVEHAFKLKKGDRFGLDNDLVAKLAQVYS